MSQRNVSATSALQTVKERRQLHQQLESPKRRNYGAAQEGPLFSDSSHDSGKHSKPKIATIAASATKLYNPLSIQKIH